MMELKQELADVLTLLAEANREWIRRRIHQLDRSGIEEEIGTLERRSRRLEEKIRKADARTA